MSTARSTLRGSFSVGLAEGLALPTGLITAAVLSRDLGPHGYGLLALTGSLIAWVQWTMAAVFSRPTVKLVSGNVDWKPVASAILRIHLLVAFSVAFVLFWSAEAIAELLREPELENYLRLFCVDILLFSMAHGYRSVLIGAGHFEKRALASGARWIARLVFVVLLVQLGYGVAGAILGSMAASAVELLISSWGSGVSVFSGWSIQVPGFWRVAAPLTLSAVSLRLFDRLDIFLLKFLGGSVEQTGAYGAAQNLTAVASVVAMSVSPLVLSSMTRALRQGDVLASQSTARLFLRLVLLLLPLTAAAAVCSTGIVTLIFGQAFREAGAVFGWLAFASFASLWISLTSAILVAEGRNGMALALTAPMVPLGVLVQFLFIPRWGAAGAAAATTLVACLAAIASSVMIHRVAGVRPSRGALLRTGMTAVVLIGLGVLWPAEGVSVLLKLAVLSTLAVGLLIALGEIQQADFGKLSKLWRKPATVADDKAYAHRMGDNARGE